MTRHGWIVLAIAAVACRGADGWTDDGHVPATAVRELASQVPGDRWSAHRLAARYAELAAENEIASGLFEHPRFAIQDSMKAMYDELDAIPVQDRLERLAAAVFSAELRAIDRDAGALAHRRLAIDEPELVRSIPDGFDDERSAFEDAPPWSLAEIEARADAVALRLDHALRAHHPLIGERLRCEMPLEGWVDAARTLLRNARGDFRVTTGRLHELLARMRHPTVGLTDFDRGLIVERRIRCPDDATGSTGGR